MSAKDDSLQDVFISELVKQDVSLTIFLVNGVKLQGKISRYDRFTVFLTCEGSPQLVFKHAISTIMPMKPFSIPEGTKDD